MFRSDNHKKFPTVIFLTYALLFCIIFSSCQTSSQMPTTSQAVTDVQEPAVESNADTAEPEAEDDHVAIRFLAASDIHIGDKDTKEDLEAALDYAKEYSGNKLDTVLWVGDLTNMTLVHKNNRQIFALNRIYKSKIPDMPLLYCLGPGHDIDYEQTEEETIESRQLFLDTFEESMFKNHIDRDKYPENGYMHMEVNGFHFISIDWDPTQSKGFSTKTLAWLRGQLNKLILKDPDKPIFIITHVDFLKDYLSAYPQVVLFTGHSHISLAREDMISQEEGITWVHCGGLNYYRLRNVPGLNEEEIPGMEDKYSFAHQLYVEVDDKNTVTITRLNVYTKSVIGEPWVISPDRRDVYTDDREETAEPCAFPEDAVMSVTETQTSENLRTLNITFDSCEYGTAGAAQYYGVELFTKNDGGEYELTDEFNLASREVMFVDQKDIPSGYYTCSFADVDCDEYALVVKAYDCWNESENALVFSSDGEFVFDGVATGKVNSIVKEAA